MSSASPAMQIARSTMRLRRALQSSYGELREREIFTVSIRGSDGVTGYGEAAPLEPYDGVSADRVHRALECYREVLSSAVGDRDGIEAPGHQLLDACRAADELPQALAAVDLALWDRAARRQGRPVALLLSDDPAGEVIVNATLSAIDRSAAAEQAAEAVDRGYSCLKMKIGVGDDAGRVAAVRAAAGPSPMLRLDANGAWEPGQAISAINALAPAGLELVEEPCHGLEAVRAVRERVSVRVSIDETAGQAGALGAGVADAVCLKISRCGGIAGLLAAASLVRASGAEVYLASSLDGPLGIAASLHAAAALASRGPLAPCGLATLGLFEDFEDPLPVSGGAIRVPSGPGLGVEHLHA